MKAATPILTATLFVVVAGTVASQLDIFGSKTKPEAQMASTPIIAETQPEPVVIRPRPAQPEPRIAERPTIAKR